MLSVVTLSHTTLDVNDDGCPTEVKMYEVENPHNCLHLTKRTQCTSNSASKGACTWCLPTSGAFHAEKRSQAFRLLFCGLWSSFKKIIFLCIFENWKKQAEHHPHWLVPQRLIGVGAGPPQLGRATRTPIPAHHPLLFYNVCLSLCRIYYYSALSSPSFRVLTTQHKTAHASISIGL